jgi:GDP-D-mannose 3', 5'-epimerase
MIVVAGAGGAIGGALVEDLVSQGARVRAVDVKPAADWYRRTPGAEEHVLDLRDPSNCGLAVRAATQVYNLAADMGGIGFIEANKARCMLSVLINTNLLEASRHSHTVQRFFYASSACVYPKRRQDRTGLPPLKESDAYPADPEDGYGWEKLFSERMCRHFSEDFHLPTRVARLHNVYGPFGTWRGGREKAPAAICRKVAEAVITGLDEIEVWGDGSDTRSFTYIDDCVYGIQAIMASDNHEPLNLGSSEVVTIGQLVDLVAEIAGASIRRRYNVQAPRGVKGRSSDNTLIRERLAWAPSTRLADGIAKTYPWIYDQVAAASPSHATTTTPPRRTSSPAASHAHHYG